MVLPVGFVDRQIVDGSKAPLRLIITTAEAAIDAAVAELGLTRVLSYQAAAGLRAGSLALALEQFEPVPWPVNLVYPGGRGCRSSCAHFSIS
jgi:DNA-binding transcriptional LysR family regulator